MKRLFVLAIVLSIIAAFALSDISYAQQCPFGASKSDKKGGINRICPVDGGKVSKDATYTAVHKGKKIGFCCAGCVDAFKKNPGKYIHKVGKGKGIGRGKGKGKCIIACPKCGAKINVKKECKKQCKTK